MLQARLVDCPPRRFVGLATPFINGLSQETNAPRVIGALWEQFGRRSGEIETRLEPEVCFGLCRDLPEPERSHPGEMLYLAGCEVGTAGPPSVPLGMTVFEIPACTLAVFQHHGPIAEIQTTLKEIYREWLPNSAYEHAGIIDLERYDHRFDPCSAASVFDYAISVRPKGS